MNNLVGFSCQNNNKLNFSSTTIPKKNKLSFRGSPWKIRLGDIGIPNSGELSAGQAIKVHEEFKLGNYLDIGDDKTYFSFNNNIRKENLSFLNRVMDPDEQRKFINYYKELTGFPNLKEVSSRIRSTFVNAVKKASSELNGYMGLRFDVLEAGYDGVCSVGRGKALPGSDIDKAYVIIKGGDSNYQNIEDVNQFKGKIWENTDQRILSYNHDEAAFPQVYTKKQIDKLFSAIADKTSNMGLTKVKNKSEFRYADKGFWSIVPKEKWFWKEHVPNSKYHNYADLKNSYHDDYVEANPFYIELSQKFPKRYSDELNVENPSRENIKNFGFVIETIKDGTYFSTFGPPLDIPDYSVSKLTNLSQLRALKNRGDVKPKRVARNNLGIDFDTWSTGKQFRFVKALIESGCANNKHFTDEFSEYFSKPGNDPFKPLIDAMME